MKVEIIERGTEVILVSRDTAVNPGFIVPRKNERICAHGDNYFVREVNHYYYRAIPGEDDFIEILVEAE
ncbi:hypothetical protein [Enterobacter hormaechei]|uniref:Uncharacterized protein n=1 Tax=Cronobacter phage CR9 TaxID=1162290 RepID=M1F1A7_9CAUD|nr:hypothetical protein CL97_gp123 [Cronobacter phage CR9]AFH21007.1 hypothetical protein CR9_123 [Cronobacter phage CR9]KAB3178538.1 hypothetical protein F9047_11485 [Escherichia coli]